jgi:hypothetical protein
MGFKKQNEISKNYQALFIYRYLVLSFYLFRQPKLTISVRLSSSVHPSSPS